MIDGWVNATANVCSALRGAALDQLLLSERALSGQLRGGPAAPVPEGVWQVPGGYRRLLLSEQQQRKVRLTLWQRFLRASGRGPALLRLLAAGSIVGTVLAVGANIGHAERVIYDGLGIPVHVQVGAQAFEVSPGGVVHVDVEPESTLAIVTTASDGRPVERFDAKIEGAFGAQVYDVAGAGPLVEWTAVYGPATREPPRFLGAPRLVAVSVDNLFEEPPQTVSTKHGEGAVRHVLRGFASASPAEQMQVLPDPREARRVALLHARWDGDLETWFAPAFGDPAAAAIVAERLARTPDDVALRRVEQNVHPEGVAHDEVCARDLARAHEKPDDGDRAYIAIRCDVDNADRASAFLAARARWPRNPWIAYGAGWADAAEERWPDAPAALDQAGRGLDPEERGHVYAALVVALGERVPQPYRDGANRLLFAVERPHFHA